MTDNRFAEVTVSALDQHEFKIRIHTPETFDRQTPIIVCLPAMGVKAKFYTPLADAFTKRGMIAVRMDLRGIGGSNTRPARTNQFGYYDIVWYDYPAIITHLKEAFPGHPIYLLGHSLGGQLAMLYGSMRGEDVDGFVLVASGSVYYKQFGTLGGLGILAGTQTAWLISKLLGSFPGHKLGFAGHESHGVISDWASQARTGMYNLRLCDHDYEQLLREAEFDLLAVSIAGDTLAPQAAVDHLCEKLPKTSLTRWHYQPTNDAEGPVDHFRWVKRNREIVDYIVSWLDGISPKEAAGGDDVKQPNASAIDA